MRRTARGVMVAALFAALVSGAGVVARPAEAPALVPLPEYVTFVHDGVLERVLAGDDEPTVLLDPSELATDESFPSPLEVVAHWWAPDGTHVLAGVRSTVNGAQRLYILDNGGEERVPVSVAGGLFSSVGEVYRTRWSGPEPVWAPDGRSIALTVFEGGAAFGDIYVVDLDGTGYLVGSGVEPSWSPDSTRIAYVRAVPGAASLDEARPYVSVGTLGGCSVDLGIGRAPVFSPDGDQVLYRTWSESGGEGGDPEQLAIATAEGGPERLLTAYGPMDDMGGPTAIYGHRFSPDGSRIYYLLGRRSDSRYVYELATDGSYAEPLKVSGLASEFTLSGDGSRLVYTGGDVYEASYQTRQQVYARDLASCAEWRLTPEDLAGSTCWNLSVSYEDRHVAFEAAMIPAGSIPASVAAHEVWTATLDGSHAWRCATEAWDAASQPRYGAAPTDEILADDQGPIDDESGPSRTGFFQAIGNAIRAFFEWLAGLFD